MKTIFVLVVTTAFCYCDPNVLFAFINHQIVPDMLSYPPTEFLQVSFPSGATVGLGNILTPTQTKDKPWVTWPAECGSYYTLVMADPDAPSRQNPAQREIRHWTVINIPGSAVGSGQEVVEYIGAGPPKCTGFHRYVLLVYKQLYGKINYSESIISNRQMTGRPMTSVRATAKEYFLGDPIYGCFYQAEYDCYSDVLAQQTMG